MTAVRATTGRYSMQYLGTHMDVVPAEAGAEDLVLWSNVADLYDPGVFDERPTPGEVVVLKHDRTVRLHNGSQAEYGARLMSPTDLDGDGEWDLVVQSSNYTDFLMGPFEQDREQGHSLRLENHHLRNVESPLLGWVPAIPGPILGANPGVVLAGPVPTRLEPLVSEMGTPLSWGAQTVFIVWAPLLEGGAVVQVADTVSREQRLSMIDGLEDGPDENRSLALPDGVFTASHSAVWLGEEEHVLVASSDTLWAVSTVALSDGRASLDPVLDLDDVAAYALGDWDGDGETDVAATVYGLREESPVAIWRGPLLGADPSRGPDFVFGPFEGNLAGFGRVLQAVDLDGDGRDELAVMAADGPGTVYVYDDPLRDWHDLNPGHR